MAIIRNTLFIYLFFSTICTTIKNISSNKFENGEEISLNNTKTEFNGERLLFWKKEKRKNIYHEQEQTGNKTFLFNV